MRVVREICVAGKVIDATVKVTSGRHMEKREQSQKVTREAVQKNNDRMAAKKLRRIFNANCDSTWCHFTLTYTNEPTVAEGLAIFKRFIERLRRAMKKLGQELKWITAAEFTTRLHHHFISNAPITLVREMWKEGHALPRPMDEGPDYIKLAEYIIKETTKTFRSGKLPFKSRYSHSRNLVIPEVRVEEVSALMLIKEPKPFKGYYIESDAVRRYQHPITGLEHLEYTMISNDADPRIKRWHKGKTKKKEIDYKRYINYEEEQESFFDSYFEEACL